MIPKSSLDGAFPDNSEFQLTNEGTKPQPQSDKPGIAVKGKSNALTTARDTLLYRDGESIGSTIMETVVAPTVRDLISNIVGSIFDSILEGINGVIYKDDPYHQPGQNRYYRGGNGYVPYSSVFNSNPTGYYNVTPAPVRNSNRMGSSQIGNPNPMPPNRGSYNNIIFPDRGTADSFIKDIIDYVNQYQSESVSAVYSHQYLNWPCMSQDTKWGWTPDLLNANTIIKRRIAGGMWRVILPRPISLDI